jgi:hypothetical protein
LRDINGENTALDIANNVMYYNLLEMENKTFDLHDRYWSKLRDLFSNRNNLDTAKRLVLKAKPKKETKEKGISDANYISGRDKKMFELESGDRLPLSSVDKVYIYMVSKDPKGINILKEKGVSVKSRRTGFRKDYIFGDKDIKKIEEGLTDFDKKVIGTLREIFDDLAVEINKVSNETMGFSVATIGDFFRLSLVTPAFSKDVPITQNMFINTYYKDVSLLKKIGRERTKGVKYPVDLKNPFEHILTYIKDATNYVGKDQALRNFKKVLNNEDLKKKIKLVPGGEMK